MGTAFYIPTTPMEALALTEEVAEELTDILIAAIDGFLEGQDDDAVPEEFSDREANWMLACLVDGMNRLSQMDGNPFTKSNTTWLKVLDDYVAHRKENTHGEVPAG